MSLIANKSLGIKEQLVACVLFLVCSGQYSVMGCQDGLLKLVCSLIIEVNAGFDIKGVRIHHAPLGDIWDV